MRLSPMRDTSTTSTTATAMRPTRDTGTSTELSGGRRGRRTPAPSPADATLHGAAAAALLRHGVRYTAHRRTLVTAMWDAGPPLTIPQLVEAASTVPQSSVYRNLAIFDDAGIVHRMPGPDDFARFELAEELMGHHHHLVCSSCGTVEDVVLPPGMEQDLDRVLRQVARQRGFSLAAHRLDLVGDCHACDAAAGAPRRRTSP